MNSRAFLLPALSLFLSLPLSAQAPFRQGVNFTGWLQEARVESVAPGTVTEQDFEDIRRLGCDLVRLPINLDRMAAASPDGRVPERLFRLLDRAVAWASANGLTLILDNHTLEEDARIDPALGKILPRVWDQMARHFRSAPPSVIFEIFNEPHDIPAAEWRRIQADALAAIRKADPDRLVIVTGSDWGGIEGLLGLVPYGDPRLLYSFHFYDPFAFTHQGADWAGQAALSGVPFPPDPARQPKVASGPDGERLEAEARFYMASDPEAQMRDSLDRASAWARERKVSLYCGEAGVYDKYADPADRRRWYALVRRLLAERGIPFSTWDYRGDFGLFEKGSAEEFPADLDRGILSGLGLSAPAAAKPAGAAATDSLPVFVGALGKGVRASSYAAGGLIDWERPDGPDKGKSCVSFSGSDRYGSFGFRFLPALDLSSLVRGGTLDFSLKLSGPPRAFDIRFVMDDGGLPWRMSLTLDPEDYPWDGKWAKASLKLSDFRETGAWDGAWHEPAGLWSWARVAELEIVAERGDFKGRALELSGLEIAPAAR